MNSENLTGYWTYRSFFNTPEPVGDFNKIRFAEAEVFLLVGRDGRVQGTLSFPADPGGDEKGFMDLEGRVISWDPVRLRFTGTGRKDTEVFDYVYDYDGELAPLMQGSVDQRATLVGTVVRSKDHGSGSAVAKAGVTASFAAVKRPHVEVRDVPELGLLQPAIEMLASRLHRLHHTVWHTVRGVWWDPLNDSDRAQIAALNWNLERPPFDKTGALDLSEGAGEDFLFMHRRMIAMVRDIYRATGKPAPAGWTELPVPASPQFAYVAVDDSNDARLKTYRYDSSASGFMVPPASDEYLISNSTGTYLKSPEYFSAVMRPLARLFTRPTYLATLSLGALGNLLEFTIHNQMHMRWTAAPRAPETGMVVSEEEMEKNPMWKDPKWDVPKNDYLGDFHSSHVNPVFWRLHGWVDDRIEDWYRAQESLRPGAVKRRTFKGVEWFDKGDWVKTDKPFDQPDWWDEHHHGHDSLDQTKINEMLKVMLIIESAQLRKAEAQPMALTAARWTGRPLTSFARWVDAESPF